MWLPGIMARIIPGPLVADEKVLLLIVHKPMKRFRNRKRPSGATSLPLLALAAQLSESGAAVILGKSEFFTGKV